MANNGIGVRNYVFAEDQQAEEDALTQKLYEYALMQPKASFLGSLGGDAGYELVNLARSIQQRKDVEKNQKEYLKAGQKWLSQERRKKSDSEILDAIKNNSAFRRRVMTLQNPDTFNDSFWWGL